MDSICKIFSREKMHYIKSKYNQLRNVGKCSSTFQWELASLSFGNHAKGIF